MKFHQTLCLKILDSFNYFDIYKTHEISKDQKYVGFLKMTYLPLNISIINAKRNEFEAFPFWKTQASRKVIHNPVYWIHNQITDPQYGSARFNFYADNDKQKLLNVQRRLDAGNIIFRSVVATATKSNSNSNTAEIAIAKAKN